MTNRLPARSLIVFCFDLLAVFLAWWGGIALAVDFTPSADLRHQAALVLWLLLPAEGAVFHFTGLYRGIWYFSSLPDLLRIARAVAISAAGLVTAFFFFDWMNIPRAVAVLYPLLLMMIMSGGRALYRAAKEHQLYGGFVTLGQPVLILGAGRAGAKLAQELRHSRQWTVVGFLDDDPSKLNREIMGQRVHGSTHELAHWAACLGVRHVILAMPSATEEVLSRISRSCIAAGVNALTVPTAEQLLSGQAALDQLRPVNLDDLLGRTPVHIDTTEVRRLLAERVVMVTGAGGSIGSELCQQIALYDPALLLLYENNEYALYQIEQKLRERHPALPLLPLAGDVKDAAWVNEIMRHYTPAVVFHAAAYKHVPLMEEHNAWQAMRNNVLGTYVVAQAALRAKVPEFVLISTDKAVKPTNVMGASKRLAEMVCQGLQHGQQTTRFEIVRFGNVLGSTGSVIPKFQAQIRKGGPVTVTHPEISRYFMSISEAAQLVLQAAAMGEGGEVFVLDMGEPIKIVDLARRMIHLSGRTEAEVPIVFTGLRPGEKLREELLDREETLRQTPHPKLRIARARPVSETFLAELLEWLKTPGIRSDVEVRRDLRRWLPEYQPPPAALHLLDGGLTKEYRNL